MTDRASRALAESDLPGEPRTYDAISKRSNVPISTLNHRALGRPSIEDKARGQLYLNPPEEEALVKHLILEADLGKPVPIKFLASLAYIIARQRSATIDEAIKPPNKNWAQGFQKRHLELKSRRVQAMDWKRHEKNIYDKIIHWFDVIEKVLQDPAIRPENVYNMDETGVMLCMLGSVKVLVSTDDLRNYRGAAVKRTMVTAIECISANGRSLLPMIIWPATTHRSNWTTFPTPGWHYACSESGYTDSKISFEWLKRVFDPQTRQQANGKPRLLICDGFGTHETLEILEFCFENNILLCRLPSHTSHKLQPCDVGVFAPLKAAYRDEVERLCRGGVNTPCKGQAFSKRNITSAWAATGLFPLNRDRVLRHTPKPPAQLPMPGSDEIRMDSDLMDEVPQTPTTPVSAEAFMSLHSMIQQDTSNGTCMTRVQRRVQKLANAGQKAIAYCALLEHEKQLLKKINSEAKVRKSTKSLVLGKGQGKVMSFEDIVAARAARAAKDVVKGKVKRGRKRKSDQGKPEPEPEPEVELEPEPGLETEPEPEPEMVRAAKKVRKSIGRRAPKRTSIAEADLPDPTLEAEAVRLTRDIPPGTWSAPVAKMY
ncbi:hypothetical protein LARI1_G009295 [Lachnellula arida]|uniref:DDE-1 domain-containing protein n=1 Tax=Lachnellula arida TaxID=1316785 RepID=A0A8T9B438_9HELO|nr:hypothetical protein LARI1_G009295 [Lachnellula arida]